MYHEGRHISSYSQAEIANLCNGDKRRVEGGMSIPRRPQSINEGLAKRRLVLYGVSKGRQSCIVRRDVRWCPAELSLDPLIESATKQREMAGTWYADSGVYLSRRVRIASIQGVQIYSEVVSPDALDRKRVEVGVEGGKTSSVQPAPDSKISDSKGSYVRRRERCRSIDEAWHPSHDDPNGCGEVEGGVRRKPEGSDGNPHPRQRRGGGTAHDQHCNLSEQEQDS